MTSIEKIFLSLPLFFKRGSPSPHAAPWQRTNETRYCLPIKPHSFKGIPAPRFALVEYRLLPTQILPFHKVPCSVILYAAQKLFYQKMQNAACGAIHQSYPPVSDEAEDVLLCGVAGQPDACHFNLSKNMFPTIPNRVYHPPGLHPLSSYSPGRARDRHPSFQPSEVPGAHLFGHTSESARYGKSVHAEFNIKNQPHSGAC